MSKDIESAMIEVFDQLQYQLSEGVAVVTLNRPESMNSMSSKMLQELFQVFTLIGETDSVNVVIITGMGRKAFSAGLDLKELSQGVDVFFQKVDDFDVIGAIENCGCPVIGAINGCAITGGFELALACDFLIASNTAKFADTHARVGLIPAWGMSQKLPRLIAVNRAREMSLTGRFISAEEAFKWGLVNHICEADALLDKAKSLAESILNCDQAAISATRKIIDYGWRTSMQQGLEAELAMFKEYVAARADNHVSARVSATIKQGREQF